MYITNPNNLPDAIVQAVTPDQTRGLDPKRMSITDLINPPMMRYLRHKHWHEMSERVDDRVWLMLGMAFHEWIDNKTTSHSEIKLEHEMHGYTVVGVIDLMEGATIVDYKVTSVYSFLLGEKDEWVAQLNSYAWLLRQVGGKAHPQYAGIKANQLKIIAILRDWSYLKLVRDPEYPKSAILEKVLPLWSDADQDKYIQDRFALHMLATPPVCNSVDRWHKEDSWAVKNPAVQKARRVLPSEEGAKEWALKNMKGEFKIEHRSGEDSRCKYYCGARKFCPDSIYKNNQGSIEV